MMSLINWKMDMRQLGSGLWIRAVLFAVVTLLVGGVFVGGIFDSSPAWAQSKPGQGGDQPSEPSNPFDDKDPIQPRFAESAPMVKVLRAVRDQDLALFKSCFSAKAKQSVQTEEDWIAGLAFYTNRIAGFCHRKEDLQEIYFVFDPDPQAKDESRGELTVVFRGRRKFALRVTREQFAWKIDEK